MADLSVDVGGVKLPNPVIAASGTFGFGREYARLVDVDRLGGICSKGITVEPREGNSGPRLWETAAGLLNSIGLENPGVERFLRDELPDMKKRGPAAIVNIWGETVSEYGVLARRLAGCGADALEVNVSCPNVPGARLGEREDAVRDVIVAVRHAWRGPIWVKLPPDAGVRVAGAAIEAGGDAIVASNTFRGMAIDIERCAPVFQRGVAGLSGPAIKPIALRVVFELCQVMEAPVIGCGGIRTWQDALEFFLAGASAVEVGTAHYIDPRSAVDMVEGLETYLRDKKIGWREIRGRALAKR
ncbi:dihydroorotate dehydrogenase [Candidatus Bipolaricaulota bacterium]|nr:dihydroorotate dehydrogenase [Candidatus Bipolaricaulota bacterium]